MRAAIYLRLSKEDKGESIENQRRLLEQYCKEHGYAIVKEYQDEALSGLSDERPAFQQMFSDAKNGLFDAIVSKNQSRFSRNFLHVEQYLHQELAHLHIRFIGVTDGVDTDGASGRSTKKARQIYALLNEWYCQEISENVRGILKQKVQRGEFIGSAAPFGYQKSKTVPGRLEPRQPQASIVKELFEGYCAGIPVRELVWMCQKKNYPAPDPKTGWSARSVYRILENECYIGTMIQGKTRTVSYKNPARVQIPLREWVKVENTHEPLISRELFEQVQKRKGMRGRKKKGRE